jgi:lipase maturation factor 1
VDKPLMIYDAECAFCLKWIARWRARTGASVEYRPFQEPGLLRRLRIPRSDARRAIQLVVDGRRYQGAEAVFRALSRVPGLRVATAVARLPLIRAVCEWVYRRVARHRTLAARIDKLLLGRSLVPPTTARVRSSFTRALGGVYVLAFASLHRQVLGLYGRRGLLPVAEYLDAIEHVAKQRGTARLRLVPTLFWFARSDRALVRACIAGEVCGAALVLGIAPRKSLLAAWALYLSFMTVGRDFLSFQWDALLLESGLAAAAVAGPAGELPPWPAVALMRTLALRLHFESGLVKLESRDPAWRSCTACQYHHETQPLPTRLGWHGHQLPRWFQRVATALVLGIELGVPVLAFAPRRIRRGAFVTLTALQTLIAASGSYGFFNVLTVVDSLWLLDDETLERTLHLRHRRARRAPWWRRLATAAAVAPLLTLAIADLWARVRPRWQMPRQVRRLRRQLAPLGAVSSYGLFAVMTTERPEIVIEGSHDGVTWREYHFRYKPGDVMRAPRLSAPHQPRLDWQMWFAAMQSPPPWFGRLLERLLEGSPEVLALLDRDPFPDRPPRYVRALLYDYRMTDRATRRRTGAWWRRELRGEYFPAVHLKGAAICGGSNPC